ncbi:translesion error-prone DNA polymerase V autoproteolytic subunit [Halomonas sp. MCCC 1A17488]|uniref:LexA family protein n=1 Tax=unclassified Halomonas TaxID=2609666 RepID=UPI0018D24C03|nr:MULTISPECIES: translesion error-prone DNA polymerase V autoproteolytic subunit [unclassified Halomonas]MCE8016442.1 translesion error-prone DNA polymerase V autoproteolytic subunit [Halomonas sp. MCCC 1A17488]MCG3239775.1 translesion error-prone DNA polymerase V autoproteolytic subunit [Halomonas sp. MCCC 1A17488]QPP50324.1 translesion error-prone DNA polymerase V autoproteolytic subunit [Halomonas sp. SS10-MC5]
MSLAPLPSPRIVGSAAARLGQRTQPLLGCRVRAGFPSPADDHLDGDLDLHAHVVRRPASTYFVRAEGDSMQGDGIHHGDLLVVDRSLEPLPGRVIVIAVDGELTVKRLAHQRGRTVLLASNPRFAPIPLEGRECHVWGVVTHVIHALPGAPA